MKFCSNCGQELSDQSNFCVVCGNAQGTVNIGNETYVYVKKKPGKGFGIAGMVLGIVGAYVSVWLFCVALAMSTDVNSSISSSVMILVYCSIYAILAIIFSGVAISKGYRNGVGKSGLILGIISIIIGFIACLIL